MYTLNNVRSETVVLTQPEFDTLLDLAHPVKDGAAKRVALPAEIGDFSVSLSADKESFSYRGETLDPAIVSKVVFAAVQIAFGK
jgi:hypothetical protein